MDRDRVYAAHEHLHADERENSGNSELEQMEFVYHAREQEIEELQAPPEKKKWLR